MKIADHAASRPGFIKLGCLGFFIAIALIWGGGQEVYTSLKNREPLKMSFKDYQEQRPTAEWVSLSGAQLNLLNCAYISSKVTGATEEVFIAVEAVGDRSKEPALVLLASKEKELIDVVDLMAAKMATIKSQADLTPELIQSLFPQREVTGVVRFGISSDSKTRDELANLDLSLEKDFIIITEGEKPSLGVGAGMLAGGLLLGFLLLRGSGKEKAAPASPAPPDLPAIS